MKTKSLYLDYLIFCYAIFSFIVYMPDDKLDIKQWMFSLLLNTITYSVYSMLIMKYGAYKQWATYFLAFYIIWLTVYRIRDAYKYINLYHSNDSAINIIIVSGFLILIYVAYKNIDLYKLAPALFFVALIFISIVIIINRRKINRCNLYYHKLYHNEVKNSVTMFDYIIPLAIINNSMGYRGKFRSLLLVNKINFILFILTILSFSMFKGDLLYSLSPLQAVFQISETNLVKNFDAFYNFLTIFMYFAALIVNLWSFDILRLNYKNKTYGILLLYIPFMLIAASMRIPFVILETIAVVICMIGREKA